MAKKAGAAKKSAAASSKSKKMKVMKGKNVCEFC